MKLPGAVRTGLLTICLLVAMTPLAACALQSDESSDEILRLALSDIVDLDPAITQDASSAFYITHIFSGLVALNAKFEVVPDLAETWQVSPDGRVYTFELRRGAQFHDGREVRAADVQYSLERAADPRTRSNVAASYLGDIVGVTAKLDGRAREIAGVSVRDDYTIEVTIDRPKAYFLAKLTYPTAYVVDRANVESGPDWTSVPNGTGPFMLAAWQLGTELVLIRNDNYYGRKAGVKEVQFLGLAPQVAAYEQGLLDIAYVGLGDIERVTDPTQALNEELQVTPDLSVSYLGLNVRAKPFDDVKVRQAFNHALDRDKIITVALRGMFAPADGILPPGLPGYSEDLKGLEYDVIKANLLIGQSSYGSVQNFPPMVLHTFGAGFEPAPHIQAIVEVYRQNLGVEIMIRQTDFASLLELLSQRPDEVQMFSLAWVADYADPQNFLDVLFHSQSGENRTGYASNEVDALLQRARTETDAAVRMRLYQQAEQVIVREAPWVPLWHGRQFVLVKPYVRGFQPSPVVQPWLGNISIKGRPQEPLEFPRQVATPPAVPI